MFEFIKERKAQAALDLVAERLPKTLSGATGLERCAARGVANAYLLAGATDFGQNFSHAPMKLTEDKVFAAVASLYDQHRQKLDAVDSLSGRPAIDPVFSAWKWEMLALELVIATAGCSIHAAALSAAKNTWLDLKKVDMHVENALDAMESYARTYAIEPVPRVGNRKPDRSWLRSLVSVMPPMYRNTKKK